MSYVGATPNPTPVPTLLPCSYTAQAFRARQCRSLPCPPHATFTKRSPYGRAVESAQCFAPAQARPEAWHGIFLGESSFWIWVWMVTQTRTWGDGNMGWGAVHCLRRISRTMALTGATSSVKGTHSMG
ncbi:hypothetical protein B0H14DRAFT_2592863 [Mycena olivaceomarginata]|nr:hypothetical protein B0H14DRAFT_2592863 [Mycena olivaceomarginata]